MRMKAKLLNTIVRAGGNPVLPAKETVTLDALAPVFPFCTGVRYPKHGNLWTEVNGERRIPLDRGKWRTSHTKNRVPKTQNAISTHATGDSLNLETDMATQLP